MLIPRQISQTVQAGNDSPIILALYSHNSLTGHFNTIILRWKLDESNAIVEPTFSQLSTKKSSNDRLPDERILRPLEEICLDRLVVDIHLLSHDTVIALCYNTGEVEFRDHDLNALTFDDDLNRVISLNRIGFSFSDSEPCLQTSLSPHAMVKVSINKAYERKLSSMQFLMPTEDPDVISQVIAAFVLEHAASEGAGGVQVDDLIMIMSEFVQQLSGDQRKMFKEQFMKDLYQTFQVTERCIDTNVDGLIKFAGLGKAVGMQSALGLRSTGNGKLRYTRPGRIALTIQSLRIIALSLSYSVANLQKGQEIDFHRPGMTAFQNWDTEYY